MDAYPAIQAQWVIATYTGDRAKYVKGLADAGIGYFVRREGGRGIGYTLEVGFLRPCDSPLPEHLMLADITQSMKLEKLNQERHGTNKRRT